MTDPIPTAPPRRFAALCALALAATGFAGCACNDIGYVDTVSIHLDRAPAADEAWELTFAPDGEPPCTVLLTADEVRMDEQDPGCEGRWVRPLWGDDYGVTLDYMTPDRLDLVLRIGGAAALETSVQVPYRVHTPEGPMCGSYRDGAVSLEVPAAS